MEFMGYSARMRRLMPEKGRQIFRIDCGPQYGQGVMRGLDTFQQTIDDMCAGGPDAITMHKEGLAERCFSQHAGITPWY